MRAPVPFLLTLLQVLTLAARGYAQCVPHGSLAFRSLVSVTQGLDATVIAANLTTPRGITIDSLDNILVIERGLGVTAFTAHDSSCDGWLRTIVVQNPNLTQGIQVNASSLYVSTSGEVLRYTYNAEGRNVSGTPVTLINNIPPNGGMFSLSAVVLRVVS